MSGQDGDHAALNRVALGTQTVSVWKDSRELGREAATAAMSLAAGKKVEGSVTWAEGEKKVSMNAMFLKALPVTGSANLDVPIKAGHITKEAGVQGRGGCHGAAPPASSRVVRDTLPYRPSVPHRGRGRLDFDHARELYKSIRSTCACPSWPACWS